MTSRPSPLHSHDPADARWRAEQAHVDADIEGLSRDPAADALVDDLRAKGIAPADRIRALVGYFKSRRGIGRAEL